MAVADVLRDIVHGLLLVLLHTNDMSMILGNNRLSFADNSTLLAEVLKPSNIVPALSSPYRDLARLAVCWLIQNKFKGKKASVLFSHFAAWRYCSWYRAGFKTVFHNLYQVES